mgnify:CR=1 FL=1
MIPGYIVPLMRAFFQFLLSPNRPGPGIQAGGVLLPAILLLVPGKEARCQGNRDLAPVSLGPDSLAAEFQAALRGMGWRAAAARLHPEALGSFHHRITLLAEMDTTGGPMDKLYPQGGLSVYHQKSREEIFLRVMEILMEDAPGLIHALVVREVEVVGHVPEGDLAHVVYRSTADLSGAQPELRLMTLKRHGQAWRVLRAQEVEVLVEAFRGITRKIRPPPGGWPGGVPPDTGRVILSPHLHEGSGMKAPGFLLLRSRPFPPGREPALRNSGRTVSETGPDGHVSCGKRPDPGNSCSQLLSSFSLWENRARNLATFGLITAWQ